MFHYLHPRGSIITFRMPADAYVANTAKPTRRFQLRTSGRNAYSLFDRTPGAAATITGDSTGIFALTGSSTASLIDAGSSSGSIVLSGSATGVLPVAGSSTGAFSLDGSATGTIEQSGWWSAGVFTLSADSQAQLIVGGDSAGTLSLTGSATGTIEQASPGGGTVDPSAVWAFVMPNGMTAGEMLSDVHAWLHELRLLHGLVPGSPLTVTDSQRTAGDIAQTIAEVSGGTSVTRV